MNRAQIDMRGIYPGVSSDLLWEMCCQNLRADLKHFCRAALLKLLSNMPHASGHV